MTHLAIQYGTKVLDCTLEYQERKTLGIKVLPDCTIKILAPTESTIETIEQKVKDKARWICKQLNEFLSYNPLTPTRKYINGETHLYLGRQYRLKIIESNVNEVKLVNGRITVFATTNSKAEQIVQNWYRTKAELHFNQLLDTILPKFEKFNIEKPELSIRFMSTRWGSCTPKGKIILNPELIKAPKPSIEYVIIHELCHLIEHNHTKAFYDLQEKFMPDWQKWKKVLEYSLL